LVSVISSPHSRYLHFSLHDALPISGGQPHANPAGALAEHPDARATLHPKRDRQVSARSLAQLDDRVEGDGVGVVVGGSHREAVEDRKSTRLNSSHVKTSYAVFCLKK